MAKINNQAVMQKLIDDLKLYPGADVIPTELAEKILPVFNVNEQDVNVSIENDLQMKVANIVRSGLAGETAAAVTLYAVPATGKFYLTNVTIFASVNEPNAYGGFDLSITVDGSTQKLLYGKLRVPNTAGQEGKPACLCLNLQNPILIDSSTNIVLNGTNVAYVEIFGTMAGYYVA